MCADNVTTFYLNVFLFATIIPAVECAHEHILDDDSHAGTVMSLNGTSAHQQINYRVCVEAPKSENDL